MERPRKRRAKSPVLKQLGGDTTYTGTRGKLPRATQFAAQSSSEPSRSGTFTPFPARTVISSEDAEQDQEDGFGYFEQPDSSYTAEASRRARQDRHKHERQQQDHHWRQQIPTLAFRRTCRQATEAQRRQKVQDSLRRDFQDRVSSAQSECCKCHTAEFVQAVAPARELTFACIRGHVAISTPTFICTKCQHEYIIHPFSVDCFHATPVRPEVWYDNELLEHTCAAQLCGPTAIQAHCSMLQQLHCWNGCGPGKQAIWSNLASAAEQYRRVEVCRWCCSDDARCDMLCSMH